MVLKIERSPAAVQGPDSPDWAEIYNRWRHSPLGRITDRLEQRVIFRMSGELPGTRVLDVGCGEGALALDAAGRGAWVVGLDSSPGMVQAARAESARRSLRVSWILGDGARLPFRAGVFDRAFAVTVLCTAAEPVELLREIARVLKTDGRLVLVELSSLSPWALWRRIKAMFGSRIWRTVTFRSPRRNFELVRRAGFSIVRAEGAIFYPPVGAAARLLAWLDPWLGRVTLKGAAIVAVACVKQEVSDV